MTLVRSSGESGDFWHRLPPDTSCFSVTYEKSASSGPRCGRCRANSGVKPTLGRTGFWADRCCPSVPFDRGDGWSLWPFQGKWLACMP